MQTFLPYSNFQESAQCLDYRRLGKQRVECKQILTALSNRAQGIKGGWTNHPAVKMWIGYEEALKYYANCMIQEWIKRGYNNSMPLYEYGEVSLPPFVGDSKFHDSHKSNLLRKDFEFYSKFGWDLPTNIPYLWPV